MSALPSTRSRPLLALAFAIAACGACSGDDTKLDVAAAGAPQNAASRIETAVVTSEALAATIAASGTIEAKRLTEIGADVPGTLASVLVEVGQSVRAGAPLFRIDPGPYEMALAEARAGLELARAEHANAAAEAARMARLVEQNAASVQRADQLRTQAEVASALARSRRARPERGGLDISH